MRHLHDQQGQHTQLGMLSVVSPKHHGQGALQFSAASLCADSRMLQGRQAFKHKGRTDLM